MRVALAAAAVASAVVVALPADAAPTPSSLRIGLVTPRELRPGTTDVGSLLYLGFVEAARLGGVSARVVRSAIPGNPYPAMRFLIRQQYDAVVTFFTFTEPLARFARQYPRTRFLVPDAEAVRIAGRPPNLLRTVFRSEQASYLAGYLAALVERRRPGRHVVSAVGGWPIPQVQALIAGFRAGALRADPHVTVLVGYSHDFVAPSLCRRVALAQIARGSGVVFNVAGRCGLGVLRAADEKGVWSVGVDVDQAKAARNVLTSVLKREDAGMVAAVRALRDGSFPASGSMAFDLRNGGVGLGAVSPRVPLALVDRLARVRRAIVAGTIRVPTTLRASR